MKERVLPDLNPEMVTLTAGLATPDYGRELFLRFVEDILKRLTDEEWERVRKVRPEPKRDAEEGKP